MSGFTIAGPQHNDGVMNGRNADFLAKVHGFESVDHLCEDIPQNADVLDVGAGLSDLGHIVTSRRLDIEWVNMDRGYDESIRMGRHMGLPELKALAPPNLTYIAGDILNPPPFFIVRRFERIFSHWVLPFVVHKNPQLAIAAMRNMELMSTLGGIMRVGPGNGLEERSTAFCVPKDGSCLSMEPIRQMDWFKSAA